MLFFQWEIFRGPPDVLASAEWNTNHALLLYPGSKNKLYRFLSLGGNNGLVKQDELEHFRSFEKAFFQEMQIKDIFVDRAQKIIKHITMQHQKRHNTITKVEMTNQTDRRWKILQYLYIGIHCRRTDHIQYEKIRKQKSLQIQYFINGMHMFRKRFQKHNRHKRLIFIFVSDDMAWGKKSLKYRVPTRDLYFGGDGDVDRTKSVGQDFALLASCNHTIESHGTFSYFAGAFAGGYKIKPEYFEEYRWLHYKNNYLYKEHPLDRQSQLSRLIPF